MRTNPFTNQQKDTSMERPANPQSANSNKLSLKFLHLLRFKSIMLLFLWVVWGSIAQAHIHSRMAWSNVGAINENWYNMDDAGLITLENTITGQPVDENEVWNYYNLIKNWNFNTDLANWGSWVDGNAFGQTAPVVLNGVVSMTTSLAADGASWHYQFIQSGLKAKPNIPYILKFKSWSSAVRSNALVFEDSPQNNYNHYGASKDPEALKGRSEWVYNTTPEPKWFTFHVVFDQMVPTTLQKIQWMLSTANATTYLDSVILIKDGDSSFVKTDYLVLSATDLSLDETEDSATVNITSNTSWEVHSDQTWLTASPLTGTGTQTITFTAQANPLFLYRTAKVTVFATGLDPQTITVKQNAKQGIPIESGDSIVENWSIDAWNHFNLIKNWDFNTDLSALADWKYWVDGGVAGQNLPVIANGCVSMSTFYAPDGQTWHYQFNQFGLKGEANVPYTLKFKSWSNTSRSNTVDFEDGPQNNYNLYGASTDPEAFGGRSEWIYYTDIEPRWFTFHVVFDQMNQNTLQKIQWMLSTANATTYLDSVILIKDADLLLIKAAELALSASHVSIGATEASTLVNVNSNTNSMAISDKDWLTVNPPIVRGNQTLTLATEANPSNKSRTATVTVYPAGLASKTITVTQESTTGTKFIKKDQDLTIYPNPTSGKVKVTLGPVPQKGTYLTVTDVTGKVILNQLILNKEVLIDLQGHSPGVYFIKTNLKDFKVHKVILK